MGLFGECGTALSGCQPLAEPTNWAHEPACVLLIIYTHLVLYCVLVYSMNVDVL